jgi:hypothetical protein
MLRLFDLRRSGLRWSTETWPTTLKPKPNDDAADVVVAAPLQGLLRQASGRFLWVWDASNYCHSILGPPKSAQCLSRRVEDGRGGGRALPPHFSRTAGWLRSCGIGTSDHNYSQPFLIMQAGIEGGSTKTHMFVRHAN